MYYIFRNMTEKQLLSELTELQTSENAYRNWFMIKEYQGRNWVTGELNTYYSQYWLFDGLTDGCFLTSEEAIANGKRTITTMILRQLQGIKQKIATY